MVEGKEQAMKGLRNFLKIRRQYDIVKVISFLLLLGTVMLCNVVFQGVTIYRNGCTPTEYVLVNKSLQNITDSQLKEVAGIDEVENVSIQKKASLTINEDGNAIECSEISAAYLNEVFQAESRSEMRTFYLTPKAYEKIQRSNHPSKTAKEGKQELKLNYTLNDTENGIARFVLLNHALFSDEVAAFCAGSSASLAKDSSEIRVYVNKKDMEGRTMEQLQNLGYEIENREDVWKMQTDWKIQSLKMKYNTGICVLCIGTAIAVRKSIRKIGSCK